MTAVSARTTLSSYSGNPDLISNDALYYFLLVNLWGPGLVVCLFGVVTNILNIITFMKQGARDTVNISLLGLAASDFSSQIGLFFTNICFLPALSSMDLPFVINDVMYIFSWCHILFTRITTWITAYITLERCLCVMVPLKVKNIFTPKRTVLYLLFVCVFMIASVFPSFYTARPAKIFVPSRNKTILGLSFIKNRRQIDNISFIMNNGIPIVAFFFVILCTVILVSGIQKKSKWRRKAISFADSSAISDRDTKIIKMVMLIAIIFITCYFPGTVIFIWLILDPEMRFDGKHVNQLLAVFSVLFHLESVNASVNIFIYLKMSSKFRSTALDIFCSSYKWYNVQKM